MDSDPEKSAHDPVKTLGIRPADPQQPELPEGTRVHRYLILGLIGKGGMGAVYKAYDPELDRRIAIKMLTIAPQKGETASILQARLMREAQALAKLNHPNVVSVFDVGVHEDAVYIAMEYIDGKTLRRWVEDDQPNHQQILQAFIAAGRGLQSAHAVGIIHRDFKPDNLIVCDNGEVKVLDFGLARAADVEDLPLTDSRLLSESTSGASQQLLSESITQVGTLIGTLVYMAPEHFLNEELDERTDQFSFCVSLFEALYGKRPFAARSAAKLGKKVLRGRFEIPDDSAVPQWIAAILRRGLAVAKDDRYPDIEALLAELQHDPEDELRRRKAERRRRLSMVAVVFLAVILPVVVWYSLRYSTVVRCKDTLRSDLEGVWGPQTRSAMAAAFLGTQVSYAQDTWERVRDTLGQYVEDWSGKRAGLCEAVWLGVEPEESIALKTRCLAQRLAEFRKLTRIFAGADGGVVRKAAQAALGLSSLSQCLDAAAVTSDLALPRDGIREAVESSRALLLTVKVQTTTGRYKEARVAAREVLQKAENLGYQPLTAEALLWAGRSEADLGRYTAAAELLERAFWQAVESQHLEVVASAGTRLTFVVGYRLARTDEGLAWAGMTKVALGFMQWPARLVTKWNSRTATVYFTKGQTDRALQHYREALRIYESLLGDGHVELAREFNNIGVVFWRREAYGEALDYYQNALQINEKALGPDHPEVAQNLNNIGLVYWKKEEHQQAERHLSRALRVWESALGVDHPLNAWPLSGLGEVGWAQGKQREALKSFMRVDTICAKRSCYPEPEGMAYFGIAKGMWKLDGDRASALAYAEKARQVYGKAPKFKKERTVVELWMRKLE